MRSKADAKQPAFTYIDAHLKGFEEWLWTRALKWKYGKVVSTAKYRKPKRIAYRLQHGRLSLVQHLTGSSRGHSDITWSESAYLRFRPDKSLHMDAAIDWHRWLQDLMILLTDSDYCLEWPEVRWGKHNCTLYFQRLASKAERPRLHECPTNLHPKRGCLLPYRVTSAGWLRNRHGLGRLGIAVRNGPRCLTRMRRAGR